MEQRSHGTVAAPHMREGCFQTLDLAQGFLSPSSTFTYFNKGFPKQATSPLCHPGVILGGSALGGAHFQGVPPLAWPPSSITWPQRAAPSKKVQVALCSCITPGSAFHSRSTTHPFLEEWVALHSCAISPQEVTSMSRSHRSRLPEQLHTPTQEVGWRAAGVTTPLQPTPGAFALLDLPRSTTVTP